MATPQVQNITQTTSAIGPSQLPYYNALMQGASSLLTTPYQPYGQERIAGFTPQQLALQQQIAGMQTPGQFGTATGLGTAAGLGSLMAGQYDPSQFYVERVRSPRLNYFQMQGPEQFGGEQAQRYMSPFIQQALEPQMREAVYSARRGQVAQDLGAARQGTYGGSRQLLAGMERERNLGQQMGDIQARGLQAAYESAQQQFERDRAAQQQAQQANLQAALGVQGLGAQYGTQAALANQQYGLEAQRLAEQSRQFGSQQGLAGLAQAGQMAQTLSNIGQAQQNADISRYGLQTSTAAQPQALEQQKYDLAYQDYARQMDYPYTTYQRYANLMSGVPQAINRTETTSGQAPGLAQQLLGAGLGAYSTYRMFGG